MPTDTPPTRLEDLPGYSIRRLQQVAVGIFLDEAADHGVTPVQFALLFAAGQQAGTDQRTLAARIGLDTSTIGTVIDRLEGRGLIRRQISPEDKRVRLLSITPAGDALLGVVMPAMLRAQERMLAPLDAGDRVKFMEMVGRIVVTNGAWSRGAVERKTRVGQRFIPSS